jgi:hypothetical protein
VPTPRHPLLAPAAVARVSAPRGASPARAGRQGRRRGDLASEALPAAPRPNVYSENELPEAPASCNVRLLVGPHEVQWTLRGQDEDEVFARLQALLARKDVQPLPPKPARPQGQWKQRYKGA